MNTVRLHAIIAARNIPDAWASECLESILSQKLPDHAELRITWTDDASSDGSPLSLNACGDDRVTLIENPIRMGGLYNHVTPACSSDPLEVCLFIGGDDRLEAGALERLADLYSSDPNVWLTYGTVRNSDGSPPPSAQMSHWDVRNHPYVWMPTTVRAGLVQKIHTEDLQIAGNWFPSAGDTSLIMPLLEMSGPVHTRYIKEPWYVRREHPQNDHKVSGRLQSFCGWEARCKPSYSRLYDFGDTPSRSPHILGHGVVFVSGADQGVLMACKEWRNEDGSYGWQLLDGAWDQETSK